MTDQQPSPAEVKTDEAIRILSVEDDQSYRGFIHRALEQSGCQVFDAEDGDKALALARRHRFRLALVDIHLPGKSSGYELCQNLKEQNRAANMEVMLTTGLFTEDCDRLKAYAAGAIRFYAKTTPIDGLLDDIRFYFECVPALRPRLRAAAAGSSPGVENSNSFATVLVINHEFSILKTISAHLKREHFRAYAVQSAYRAILLAHTLRPHMIILDVSLKDLDGREVIRILKAHPRTKDIPIIVWTRSRDRGLELSCLQEGATEYLIKAPHDVSTIALRIKKRLGIGSAPVGKLLERGPVIIDLSTRKILVNGRSIAGLAPKEFILLVYLLERSPAVVPWNDIETDLWNALPEQLTYSFASGSIEVHLRRLKEKLGNAARCLVTHKGIGLQFVSDKAVPQTPS